VETVPATQVTDADAVLGGTVTDDGGRPVTRKGVVVATSPDPSLENGATIVADSAGTGAFVLNGAQLASGTTYHVRAFATNHVGSAYGTEVVFTTRTSVVFDGGLAAFARHLLPGDSHFYDFSVAGPRLVSFSSAGGAPLRAELLSSGGSVIETFTGDADFTISELLRAGDYVLRIHRTAGIGTSAAYSLDLDASVAAVPRPDVSVGTTTSASVGKSVYLPTGQEVTLNTRRLGPVNLYAAVANRGNLPDTLTASAGGGTRAFGVRWFSGVANVTAGLITGTFLTQELTASSAEVSLRAEVSPDGRQPGRRRGNRGLIQGRTLILPVRAVSTFDSGLTDGATIRVRTK
jgi:hypothetical protein